MRGNFIFLLYLWNGFTKIPSFALKFPQNFTFATCSSSYQIEGAWQVDGKGEHIWDRLTHTRPDLVKDGLNGDDAAKSYYLYSSDSNFIKEIGFDMYRFSIMWTRILPNGDLSEINQVGIQHYNDVINDLIEKNIEPMVTIYHWDLPQKLQDYGGWLNSSIADHITNYADLLFAFYGDRVKWWITINEPSIMVQGYCDSGVFAPSLGLGSPSDYIVTHNILLSHMRIYRLYEKKYKTQQQGKISISLVYDTCFPKSESYQDMQAAERKFQFMTGIFANPIFSEEGDYPKVVRDMVQNHSLEEGARESRLPEFTEEERLALIGSSDFFSLNHYATFACTPLPRNSTANMTSPCYRDMDVLIEEDPSILNAKARSSGISPKGFRAAINKVSKEYNDPVVFITENGYGDSGQLNDTSRINYFTDYLNELLNAYYYDKCNIMGYTVWSITDNFEWTEGYTAKMGLISVDFNSTDRKRTRKLSSYYFQKLIANKEIPSGY